MVQKKFRYYILATISAAIIFMIITLSLFHRRTMRMRVLHYADVYWDKDRVYIILKEQEMTWDAAVWEWMLVPLAGSYPSGAISRTYRSFVFEIVSDGMSQIEIPAGVRWSMVYPEGGNLFVMTKEGISVIGGGAWQRELDPVVAERVESIMLSTNANGKDRLGPGWFSVNDVQSKLYGGAEEYEIPLKPFSDDVRVYYGESKSTPKGPRNVRVELVYKDGRRLKVFYGTTKREWISN